MAHQPSAQVINLDADRLLLRRFLLGTFVASLLYIPALFAWSGRKPCARASDFHFHFHRADANLHSQNGRHRFGHYKEFAAGWFWICVRI